MINKLLKISFYIALAQFIFILGFVSHKYKITTSIDKSETTKHTGKTQNRITSIKHSTVKCEQQCTQLILVHHL